MGGIDVKDQRGRPQSVIIGVKTDRKQDNCVCKECEQVSEASEVAE